ncbi:MAG: hypothetical protein HYX53_03875 [Chloroflexi bacterium]|nr:hypothetical protein [Chloroflexota bacterium]
MKIRAVLAVVVAILLVGLPAASREALATDSVFNVASESYYRLDVPNATMSVQVDAEFQAARTGLELPAVPLWVMPGATNVVAKSDGTVLTTKVSPAKPEDGLPALVLVTLAKPIKGALKAEITLTYDVPEQVNDFVRIEKGSVEGRFVSQGPGSFVYVDVPPGDTYFEPGCLKASDQPKSVKEANAERWICGDALLIVLNTQDPEVLKRCANADDRCRQRANPTPYSAFVQSITDPNLRGTLEADVTLTRGPVKVTLRYFRRDEAWAEKEFAMAKAALPKLEQTYGFNYPRDTILIRQSHFIQAIGAAGIAFPDDGQVLITNTGTIDEEVTVHELAHLWAGQNLQTAWLWEGLAEYGLRSVAPSLNITPRDWKWQSYGYKDPLATWWDGSAIRNSNYWYGKAGAFWFAYQEAIGGPAMMNAVLARLDDYPAQLPVDGRWFMDRGEEVSGANLDALFLAWVWRPETATTTLADRRVAHDQVKLLTARAGALGFTGLPSDIQSNLDTWTFGPVPDQLARAGKILDSYDAVLAKAAEAGLPPVPGGVARAWAEQPLAGVAAAVEDQRQAIDAIIRSAAALQGLPEDAPAMKALATAREKYAAGDLAAAEKAAASASTLVSNQIAAGKMIEVAKLKQSSFKPSFFAKVGLYFVDPAGDLAKAEAAYAGGDPTTALKLSGSAYDGWNDASARGVQRLAILTGLMCAFTLAVWWLLKRLDPDRAPARALGTGHVIEAGEARSRWKDWENTR